MPGHIPRADEQDAPAPPPEMALAPIPQAVREPIVAADVTDPPESRSPRLLLGAIVVSGGLHVAAAAAMLLAAPVVRDYGVLTQQTDAISVETTQTTVLEAIEAKPIDAAASAAATAMQQGRPVAADAQLKPQDAVEEIALEQPEPETIKAKSQVKAEPNPVALPEEPLDVVRGASEPSEHVDVKSRERVVEEPSKTERSERAEKPRKKVERARAAQPTAGGATSRANAARAATSGRLSASRGSVLSYAARVRAKVARNRPPGNGHRGTARVSFGVSQSGGLSYVGLARSSGNAALDQAAVSAVRRAAPFGSPPSGASSGQLRFSVPFYFR